MDQDRLKKLYQRLLDESYDNRLSITEFRALRTHSYDNEKNEWIPDSYSVFIFFIYFIRCEVLSRKKKKKNLLTC